MLPVSRIGFVDVMPPFAFSKSSITGMLASKNFENSWQYSIFQVYLRAHFNLNYSNFSGFAVIDFPSKNHGHFYSKKYTSIARFPIIKITIIEDYLHNTEFCLAGYLRKPKQAFGSDDTIILHRILPLQRDQVVLQNEICTKC